MKIIVKDTMADRNYVNDEVVAGYAVRKIKSYLVCVTTDSLYRIKDDGGLDLNITMYHELAHIHDMYHTENNKYLSVNPINLSQKTEMGYVISYGWYFWTEFNAYYFTFDVFRKYHNYPTFLQLVKAYEKLVDDYAKIEPILDDKSKELRAKGEQFICDIKAFTYAIAKYLAGYFKGVPKNYKYSSKTINSKSFKKVDKLVCSIINKIAPFFTNTYGCGMERKLYNLGKVIIKNVYCNFDIYPIKHKEHYAMVFWVND